MLFHSRLVVGNNLVHGDRSWVLTPDLDDYEEWSAPSRDVRSVVPLESGWQSYPPGIRAANVYDFDQPPSAGVIAVAVGRWHNAQGGG